MTLDQPQPSMVSSPCAVREAFAAALASGELETIETLFPHTQIQHAVHKTNLEILETAPTDPAMYVHRNGSLPWFRWTTKSSSSRDNVPLLTAARNGHDHVLAWFFSDERAALMGATLAFVLPLVARFDEQRPPYRTVRHNQTQVLEALLSSRVFYDYVPDDQKQQILDAVGSRSRTPALLTLAVSYGAHVEDPLTVGARHSPTDDVLATELLTAAKYGHLDSVRRVLASGCVDVDARDDEGKTPLMLVASIASEDVNINFDDERLFVARELVEYSDLNAQDDDGCTALHYAIEHNHEIQALLLQHGADATIRDRWGFTALESDSISRYRVQMGLDDDESDEEEEDETD